MPIKLSRRLKTCASMLPKHYPRLLDVGCDHAQLGIHQLQTNRCQSLLAIDLEAGPLARAEEAIGRAGLKSQALCLLNNGLQGLELLSNDAIVMAGMGGLEICDILEQSSFNAYLAHGKKGSDLRLVLQAMKSQPLLRVFLAYQGFSLIDESIVREREKVYTLASYSFPETKLELGLKDRLMAETEEDMLFAIHKKALIKPIEAVLGHKIALAVEQNDLDSLTEEELYYYQIEMDKLMTWRETAAFINGLGHVSRLFEENYFRKGVL